MSFDHRYPTPTFPSMRNEEVTPSNSTEYDPPFRALYVGTGGDVAITDPSGNTTTWRNVPDGSYVLSSGVKVNATTTAADIIAIF